MGCGEFIYGRVADPSLSPSIAAEGAQPTATHTEAAPNEPKSSTSPAPSLAASATVVAPNPAPRSLPPPVASLRPKGATHSAELSHSAQPALASRTPEPLPTRQGGLPPAITRSSKLPPTTDTTFFDVTGWLGQRGVHDVSLAFGGGDDVDLDDCRSLGQIDRYEAIRCPRHETASGLFIVHDEVWLLDRGKLRRVLSVPVAAGAIDHQSADLGLGPGVKLTLSFDGPTKSIDVSDPPDAGCDDAYARHRQLLARRKLAAVAASFKHEVDVVCDARGRYVFQNGTFHVTSASAAPSAEPLGRDDALAGGRE
jgi:hypothetical protein